jgi:threonine synthase
VTAFTGRLACPRCRTEVPVAAGYSGCPSCAVRGIPENVHPVYDLGADTSIDPGAPGLFRYHRLLPLGDGVAPVSLGEGGTPLVPWERAGVSVGVARLFCKDETGNPTWSYKDRLAAVAVTAARAAGAETVVVGTTGNHGAAAAAYAAAAGMRCVALTLVSVPETMKVLMQVYGADVAAVSRPEDRWTLMRRLVAERGWVPLAGLADPPVGSNPVGIDGYKTIAYEIVDALADVPDAVLVPVAYGDGLAGIHRGFRDLLALDRIPRVPRLYAVEPLGPYSASFEADGDRPVRVPHRSSVAFSIAGTMATNQGLRALRESGGGAIVVGDDAEILAAQAAIAAEEGCYLEASAAVVLPALRRLVGSGEIGGDETVVAIGTSSGLKDVAATAAGLAEVPVIPPDVAALDEVLSR